MRALQRLCIGTSSTVLHSGLAGAQLAAALRTSSSSSMTPDGASSSSSCTSTQSPIRPQGPSASSSNGNTMKSEESPHEQVLLEIVSLLKHQLLIGELFKLLSPGARATLVKTKMPLEHLLLQYPDHFSVFHSKSGSPAKKVMVAPPSLVPPDAHILRLPGDTRPRTLSSVTYGDDFVDSVLTLRQRLEEVLVYIPNEWTSYHELGIPYEVKCKYMGYPSTTPKGFFTQYPAYFDLKLPESGHQLHVRRSLALQERIRQATASASHPQSRQP